MDKYWFQYIFIEGFKKVILHEDKKFYRFVDKEGNLLPTKFLTATDFRNGYAIVTLENEDKFTFIDKTGKPFAGRYRNCMNFSDGMAAVLHENGKWGYIDEKGKETPAIYDFAYQYENGKAVVVLNDKELLIDKTGKVLDKPEKFKQVEFDL
jgi:hypothetical protein